MQGGKGGGLAPTGESFEGTVKSVSTQYGFIQSETLRAAYGGDCFCLAHQLSGFNRGDPVAFTIGLSKDGKPQAIEVAPIDAASGGGSEAQQAHFFAGWGSGGGKGGGSQPEPTGESFEGTVKSVSTQYGFIQSETLQAAYGCDCFCLAHQLAHFNRGDPVAFTIGLNKEGKPQGIDIELMGAQAADDSEPPLVPFANPVGGKGGGSQPEPTGEVFEGTVKSMATQYGFIESEGLKATYGCDCFCLAHQLAPFSRGDPVAFTVGLNKEGKPQAIDIEASGEPSGGKAGAGKTGGKACGKASGKFGAQAWDPWGAAQSWEAAQSWGACKGGAGGWGAPGMMPMPTPTGETLTGTIKSITPKFGFIESAEIQAKYGGDVYCLGRQLQQFNVGDEVEFQVGINEEGKPQALSVSCNGIVCIWNDGKGTAMRPGGGSSKVAAALAGKGKSFGGWGAGGACGGKGGGDHTGKGIFAGKTPADFASPSGAKTRPEGTGETFSGIIKSLSPKFGFIQSEELSQKYGGDCFCLGEQMVGFNVGDQVYFEVGVNAKGQPQALSISTAADYEASSEPAAKAMRWS